jgi:hypothetical protein
MAINLITHARRIAPALMLPFVLVAPAAAQQATQAQQNAIRQACPADYQAHCANVPAAGTAAFACLQRNVASLSPACQRAVKAVSAGPAPHTASSASATPAASAPQSAGSAQFGAPMTMREELALLRQSCAGDFHALCSGVPLGGGRAIACLRANAQSLSPRCGEALSAARGAR